MVGPPRPTFRLELVDMGSDLVSVEARLRQGLKFLRRRFRLRCTSVSELRLEELPHVVPSDAGGSE